jgi:site-specific DNA recombinase
MKRVAQPATGVTIALIYTRVSSDEQAREGLSLDAQLAACRRYAAEKGWVLGKEYQDVMSGRRDDRPDYLKLLAEIRYLRSEGQRVVVVVMALDRFGRRLLERVQRREELKALGVEVHSVREGIVNDLMANMLAVLAQEEVERLSIRVREVRVHLHATGWHPVGRCAWGFVARAATDDERRRGAPMKVLDLDSVTAPYVHDAFARAAAGESVRKVAAWVAGLPDPARGGRAMSWQAVRRMLSAPVYIARPDVGHRDVLTRPRGNWPALVDDETWGRVQRHIASHARLPRQASGRHLLTGLIRCYACGARMVGGAASNGLSRYYCAGQYLGTNAPEIKCRRTVPTRQMDAAALVEIVTVVVAATSADPRLQSALRWAWSHLEQPDERDETARQVATIERAAEKARQRLKRLALLFADDEIDRQGYELGRDEARLDLDKCEVELERLRGSTAAPALGLPPLDAVLEKAGGWARIMQDGDVAARREVFAELVEVVVPERVGYGTYRACITWTPLGQVLRTTLDAPRVA